MGKTNLDSKFYPVAGVFIKMKSVEIVSQNESNNSRTDTHVRNYSECKILTFDVVDEFSIDSKVNDSSNLSLSEFEKRFAFPVVSSTMTEN